MYQEETIALKVRRLSTFKAWKSRGERERREGWDRQAQARPGAL